MVSPKAHPLTNEFGIDQCNPFGASEGFAHLLSRGLLLRLGVEFAGYN